jgi:hypothetical protein
MRSKNVHKYAILLVVWIISAVRVGRFVYTPAAKLGTPFSPLIEV